MNAMSLSRLTMDGAKMAGSLAGAALLSRLGMGAAYAAVTACYLASAAFALGIARPEPHSGREADTQSGPKPLPVILSGAKDRSVPRRSAGTGESPFATLRSGLGYMRHQPAIVAIMFLAFLVNLTVFPLTNGLMPVVARDAFAFGPGGLAALLTAVSVGALAGSLGLAAFARAPRPERTMLGSIVLWHALLLVFTQVSRPDALWPALAVLALYGAATSGAMVTMSAVLLGTADVAFRGRVMGVRMMAVYGLPLGLLLGGYLSERLGVHHAMSALAVLGLALTAVAAARWPALWRGAGTSSGRPSVLLPRVAQRGAVAEP
jgi:predicted MFS family arabinose efflux permease